MAFKLDEDADHASLLAWTTTPWTLPSNLGLCVHPDMTYVKVLLPSSHQAGWLQLQSNSFCIRRSSLFSVRSTFCFDDPMLALAPCEAPS